MSKLLIVDDNQQNLYMLEILLKGNGFEVESASNGAEALEKAHSSPPEMIISDILMPVMDGFSLCRAWHEDRLLKKIPFVFYTATYTDPKDEEFALSLGALRFIKKPIEPDEFMRIVLEVLEKVRKGAPVLPREPVMEEKVYMKEYNARLVKKLEDKMLQLEQANRRLLTLFQASTGMASVKPTGDMIPHTLSTVMDALGYTKASYFTFNEEKQEFWLHEAVGFPEKVIAKFRKELLFKLGEERGLVGLVGSTREPLIVTDTSSDPRWITVDKSIRSALFLPFVCTDQLKGVVSFLSTKVGAFTRDDVHNLMILVNNMAIAIENASLFDQLQRSELYYRTILENSADAIISMDPECKITVWNTGAEHMFGYTKEEILGQPLSILIPDHEQAQEEKVLREVRKRGFVRNVQTQRKARDGRLVDVETTISSLGLELGSTAVLRDITKRKRAEKERQVLLDIMQGSAATQNLQEFLHLIHHSIARVIDAENISVVIHDTNTGLFEEIYTVDKYDLPMPPSKLEKSITSYVFRTAEPLLLTEAGFFELVGRGEMELVGTPSACWLGAPIKTPTETIGVISVQNYEDANCYSERDQEFLASVAAQVSQAIERKQMEDSLRQNERNLSEAQRIAKLGSWEYDVAADKTSWSDEMYTIYGVSPADFQLTTDNFLGLIHPEDREAMAQWLDSSNKGHVPGELDYRIVHPDKTIRHLRGRAETIFDASGKPVRLIGTDQDITEGKLLEEETLQRLQELEAINRISTALRTAQTVAEMLPILLDETLKAVDTDAGSIYTFDAQTGLIRMQAARGWYCDIPDRPAKISESIAAQVLESGKAYITREFAADPLPEWLIPYVPPGHGGAVLPIQAARENIGVFFISVPLPRVLTDSEINLLSTLAEIAGNAIRRASLHAEAGHQLQRLDTLRKIDQAISSVLDLRLTLNILLDQIISHMDVDAADVLLLNPHTLTLEYAAGRGFRTSGIERTQLRLGEGYAGQAALERRLVSISNLDSAGKTFLRSSLLSGEDLVAYFGLPLIAKGQVKGVLEIFNRSPIDPDKEWLNFLDTLAGQAAIAIDNGQLFNGLERSNMELALAYDTTLEGWSRALDLRDKETEGHTQRVTDITVQLARIMGIPEGDLVHIRRGALLHDIGKMGVPDGILFKPGSLSEADWLIMRKHPLFAYDLLSPIQYLRASLDIPYCHHEKWDGTGYPRQLKEEQIPLSARIFAVVDVWDALTSDRPYRPAWSKTKALDYIREQSGKHFDPRVVTAFLDLPR